METPAPPCLPEAFVTRLINDYPGEAPRVLEAINEAAVKSVNHNRKKGDQALMTEPLPWNRYGSLAPQGLQPALDPLWHAGCYYVMEPASQAVAAVVEGLQQRRAVHTALDLCAAPGGKTSIVLNVLDDHAVLVSNEVHRGRSQVLYENAVKWGRANHIVTSASPEQFSEAGQGFDLVLVDAPCSGEGMFRKDPEARKVWSEANVAACAVRQRSILDEAAKCVNEGGFLVYSTCTFAHDENDMQVGRLLASGGWEIVRQETGVPGAVPTRYGVQFMPGISPTEGLYLAVLEKVGPVIETVSTRHKRFFKSEASGWVEGGVLESLLPFVVEGERMWAMPEPVLEVAECLRNGRVPVLKAGILCARKKGQTWLPDHELALFAGFQPERPVPVGIDEARDYLRGVSGRGALARGWRVLTYEGRALGYVKSVGDRWNNAYPKHWRLRQ